DAGQALPDVFFHQDRRQRTGLGDSSQNRRSPSCHHHLRQRARAGNPVLDLVPARHSMSAKPKPDDPGDLTGIPIRVLIVDDDEAHAQAVAQSLERIGCETTVANSGKRGVALIESENFDVVVTDMKMDEVDGLEILAKTKEELPDAEVIVVTGHG